MGGEGEEGRVSRLLWLAAESLKVIVKNANTVSVARRGEG